MDLRAIEKMSLNAYYPNVGNKHAVFYNPQLAAEITEAGREYCKQLFKDNPAMMAYASFHGVERALREEAAYDPPAKYGPISAGETHSIPGNNGKIKLKKL